MHVNQTPGSLFFRLVALTVFACLPAAAMGETVVGGILAGTSRWAPAGNPYIVESDVIVPRGAELVIYPGTRIVVNEGLGRDKTLPQFDKLDSSGISIRIEGMFTCVGRKTKRIVFVPAGTATGKLGWCGIIFNRAKGHLCELAYADVTGAYCGVTVKGCSPLIRSCVFEQNNVGINCQSDGAAQVFNCIISNNFSAGIRVGTAAPYIANSIIIDNKNNGLWCEAGSKFKFEFNCVYNNNDGDFLDCDPLLGRLTKKLRKKDSVDYAGNLYCDPVFFGGVADSIAFAHDISLPTDRSLVKKVSLALVLADTLRDSSYAQYKAKKYPRFSLSKYSPCMNTGDPGDLFKDVDGTRNDRGIYGGPKKFERPVQ